MGSVKRTSLFGLHRELGARTIEFGGFEMPLSYRGIIEEHLAVRNSAGLFDLSHMGEFEISGRGALALLERALTNSAARLSAGQVQYTLMCAEDGGTIDDLVAYCLGPHRYMLCVNAANIATDREWLHHLNCEHTQLRDISDETALIAIQGPMAHSILAPLTRLELAPLARFHALRGEIAGVECLLSRTGYTGEDGFEMFLEAADAPRLFGAILEAGEGTGTQPCGLGARDTLRLEAGLPLYGHELDRATSPLEAGLSAFVRFGRGFIGEQLLTTQKEEGLHKRLAGIRTEDGKSIARQGYPLYLGERQTGVVTSGTYAPGFKRPLAMAYLTAPVMTEAAVTANLKVQVEIRNRRIGATVVALPFYRRK